MATYLGCTCVFMYTYIYEKTPGVHTNLRMCVGILAYMNAAFTCGCIHFWMYTHECVYIFTYMCAEFTRFGTHIYMYGRRVYSCSCIRLHICTPSLQVVYVFTYTQTAFTCVCVYINIYTHGNYMFEGLYLHIHIVYIQRVCIQIQTYMSVFVSCLRVCFKCVCRYIHMYRYTRKTPWTHTDTLYAHRNTWIRIWVCTCVFMYTYIYEKTPCVHTNLRMCVGILAYMNAAFTCGCIHF